MGAGSWFFLVMILPLSGVLFSLLIGSRYTGYSAVIFSSFLLLASVFLLISTHTESFIYRFEWLPNLDLGFHISRLNAVLMVLVSLISLLVQVFSLTYMRDELAVKRYFSLLLFFIFSMLGLLAADHLILLFVFWELVGVSSYFLIGFWFQRKENALAARKAFIINRIADVALLSGIILLWVNGHTLFISGFEAPQVFAPWLIMAGFGILIGAMGKSAQFPFFTWLPAAMAGPTPVSALIHAATMVAAGVYLLARMVSILAPEVMLVMVVVGAVTALIGALVAVFQSDIKKVLAYSTVSQLGYMVLAIGVNSAGSALFHLWTHAFFKAGLFLAAGSVIHTVHYFAPKIDAQDMSKMGGLKRCHFYCSLELVNCWCRNHWVYSLFSANYWLIGRVFDGSIHV
jgi:NADH-quinone oxidoreductase subunit L